MKYLSLSQAATLVNKSKSTISKAIQTGRLKCVDKTSAGFQIEPEELFRVFSIGVAEPVQETIPVQKEPDLIREMIDDLRLTVSDLRKRLDYSEAQRERLLSLLETKKTNLREQLAAKLSS